MLCRRCALDGTQYDVYENAQSFSHYPATRSNAVFSILQSVPPDPILSITAAFRADPRSEKLDLGVGVYRDEDGNTPILAAVREAERVNIAGQITKSYLSPAGNEVFNDAMVRLVLEDSLEKERTFAVQTPGGTGAVKNLLDLVCLAKPDATVWLSDPTWANHKSIAEAAGLTTTTYPYYNAASSEILFDAMMTTLEKVRAGDVMVLHGCCHNPTGADLDLDQWRQIAERLSARGAVPLVDIAYQGLGDGLEKDATAIRLLAGQCEELLIAASCSKNFGLYRDRVGVAIGVLASANEAKKALGNAAYISRSAFSMPPDGGAAIVARILESDALRSLWTRELEAMRLRMIDLRTQLAGQLRLEMNDGRFDFLAHQNGMFSLLGIDRNQAESLVRDHAVYLPASGRINLAGLRSSGIKTVASAIAAVCR